MDWTNTGYSYLVEANVVSQTNVDNTLGSLSGVVLDGLTVTENYNSDSRVQAKISTVVADTKSDGYIDNARIRIILSIPERSWHRELITGYVSNIQETTQNGYTKREYTVEGTIWGLLEHKMNTSVVIGKGAKMINVWTTLMRTQTRMQYSATNAQDKTFGNNAVYEPGTELSKILFEVSSGYNRMVVDGHGIVLLVKYTTPSSQKPSRVIDYHDVDGLALYPLSYSSSKWEAPGRAIVTANVSTTDSNGKTTQQIIAGYYDAPSSHYTSIVNRGYLRARSDSYSGVSEKPTQTELNDIAKKNWQNNVDKGIAWTCSSVYADYHAGDVCTLITPGDYSSNNFVGHKVLLQSVQTNLQSFTQDLTMKEV